MEIDWTIWNEAFFCRWTFPIFMVGEFLEWLQTSSPTHTWWPSNPLSYHIRQKKKTKPACSFPREWLFYVVLMVGEDHENFPRTFPKRHLLIGWVPTASPTGRCPGAANMLSEVIMSAILTEGRRRLKVPWRGKMWRSMKMINNNQ